MLRSSKDTNLSEAELIQKSTEMIRQQGVAALGHIAQALEELAQNTKAWVNLPS